MKCMPMISRDKNHSEALFVLFEADLLFDILYFSLTYTVYDIHLFGANFEKLN